MRTLMFRGWNKPSDTLPKGGFTYYDIRDAIGGVDVIDQFTGLTDKNGKEIYEGDIVRNTKTLPQKRNGSRRKKLIAWKVGKNTNGWPIAIGRNYEVIGNIHENPELL